MGSFVRRLLIYLFIAALLVASGAAVVHGQPPAGRLPETPHTLFFPEVHGPSAFAFQPSFKISVDPTAHADYGLAYPATYHFKIPRGSSTLNVYRRYTLDGPWTFVPKKTSTDFFNGIEAVRFDFAANTAFVSVAFGAESDDIYLTFVDSAGALVPSEFVEIAKYYDARAAAVVVTGDDEVDWFHDHFQSAYRTFIAAKIWFTSAINTASISSTTWADIQSYVDQGYVEPACHSRTHPLIPYPDYDSEVGGCSTDIKENLRVPYPKGSTEVVVAYVDPYGYSDATLRSKLAQYKYLVERSVIEGVHTFAAWNATDGLYERTGVSICADGRSHGVMNNLFDSVKAQHGIYHLYLHPWRNDWWTGTAIRRHIDYIKGRNDVWYVGFGHLYLYHFVQERGKVTVTALDADDQAVLQ